MPARSAWKDLVSNQVRCSFWLENFSKTCRLVLAPFSLRSSRPLTNRPGCVISLEVLRVKSLSPSPSLLVNSPFLFPLSPQPTDQREYQVSPTAVFSYPPLSQVYRGETGVSAVPCVKNCSCGQSDGRGPRVQALPHYGGRRHQSHDI